LEDLKYMMEDIEEELQEAVLDLQDANQLVMVQKALAKKYENVDEDQQQVIIHDEMLQEILLFIER